MDLESIWLLAVVSEIVESLLANRPHRRHHGGIMRRWKDGGTAKATLREGALCSGMVHIHLERGGVRRRNT